MELVFLALLFVLMMYALGSGFPVAFALPGSAIVTIVLAGMTGYLIEGDSGAYFIQDGPIAVSYTHLTLPTNREV